MVRVRAGGKLALPIGLRLWYHKLMDKSIRGTNKSRGRPPSTGAGVQIGTRWQEPTLEAIDNWRRRQDDLPNRSEAIRRLVEQALAASATSDGAAVEQEPQEPVADHRAVPDTATDDWMKWGERRMALRPVFAELAHLSANKAAQELNRRGIKTPTTNAGQWSAKEVLDFRRSALGQLDQRRHSRARVLGERPKPFIRRNITKSLSGRKRKK